MNEEIRGEKGLCYRGRRFFGQSSRGSSRGRKELRSAGLGQSHLGTQKYINKKAEFAWYDIRDDEHELIGILKSHQIEYVFNYAAEPYIPEGFERPKHFFIINALAVLNVLNACQKAGVKKFYR